MNLWLILLLALLVASAGWTGRVLRQRPSVLFLGCVLASALMLTAR